MTNRDEPDPGHVGRVLAERGWRLRDFTRESHADWEDIGDAALVLSLGSSWSTYWDHVSSPVRAEQRLMAEAIGRDIPILGICFGAQQLSVVLGGSVGPAPSAEIGWHAVAPVSGNTTPPPTGPEESAVLHGAWMQWHYDAFTVPPGARLLATSAGGPQAFRQGRCLGVQFHPEATEAIVSRWSQGDGARELHDAGIDVDELLAATRAHQEHSRFRCERLVEWFLTDVAQLHMNP